MHCCDQPEVSTLFHIMFHIIIKEKLHMIHRHREPYASMTESALPISQLRSHEVTYESVLQAAMRYMIMWS